MLIAALLLLQGGPSLDQINALAKARDVEGLSKFVAPLTPGVENPLPVLKTGGAYDVGSSGWTALAVQSPDERTQFVVLTTRMTSEDVGEIVFRRDAGKLTYVPESDDLGVSITHHSFDLLFAPAQKRATVTDKVSLAISSRADQPFFLFRMSPQYKVTSIEDDANGTLEFRQGGGVVVVQIPKDLGVGTGSFGSHGGSANARLTSFTVRYSAIVDLPNFAGSISPTEATLTNDYWYPMIARHPATYDIAIHAPKNWVAVAQGELQSADQTASESITKYKMDLPCVFYSVSAAPYKTLSQSSNGRRYSVWSLRMSPQDEKKQTEFYPPIVDYYSSSFGSFPFTGYGAVDSAVYGGGALEAYSFATYGNGFLPDEDAHEPAHTWWGGILNNTYLHSFWNESFAVFSDGMYHRNVPIGNVEERRLAFIQDGGGNGSYKQVPIAESGAFTGPIGSSLGYGKGGQVLQMLEQLIGHEKMVQTMHAWIAADHGRAVDWEDYERVAERVVPDRDLKSFFDSWIRKPGYADLKISQPTYSAGAVRFDLAFNGAFYRMPLDVMLQYPDGSRRFELLDIKGPGTQTIPSSRKPSLVSIDPWRRALRDIRPDETPVQMESVVSKLKRYTDPAHAEYMPGTRATITTIPANLNGIYIVGHPETTPQMKKLCELVGFKVQGNALTYKGTTIDLTRGAAIAVIDLPSGGRCAIGLGKTRHGTNPGRARLALLDDLGRFLRGVTDPKTTGNLTFKL